MFEVISTTPLESRPALFMTHSNPSCASLPVKDSERKSSMDICQISPNESTKQLIGEYINCYIGYSTDKGIRRQASSGGLVTELLLFLLDEGIITGALVTRMSRTSPLKAEFFLAHSREEIIDAMGSKYIPIPLHLHTKEILAEKSKVSIVGLPCHMKAFRKAEALNDQFREKIILHMGLFCGHTPNPLGTRYLLNKLKISESDVLKISYRGDGWPGNGAITLKNGKIIKFSFGEWLRTGELPLFKPPHCMLCCDKTSSLSDVSFGDAWKLGDSPEGLSIAVSRSTFGEKVLGAAKLKKRIVLERISPEDIIRSQDLRLSMTRLVARNRIWSIFESTSNRSVNPYPTSFLQLIHAMIYCTIIYLCQRRSFQNLIVKATFLSKAASILIR